ncbi:MAG: hypothetical protein ACXWKY_18665, partial [Caulobacteraceae bacterium]
CDQTRVDRAHALYIKGMNALQAGALSEATQFAKSGVVALGSDYDPYVETHDDTGLKLMAADAVERGRPNAAVRGRLEMLESRLGMYMQSHQCRADLP